MLEKHNTLLEKGREKGKLQMLIFSALQSVTRAMVINKAIYIK